MHDGEKVLKAQAELLRMRLFLLLAARQGCHTLCHSSHSVRRTVVGVESERPPGVENVPRQRLCLQRRGG